MVPRIVAEALVQIRNPLETILRPGPTAPVTEVVRAIARSVAPLEANVAVPGWLRPEQHRPFRRAVAAVEWHGGALLADPVGSGKTWIALAVAKAVAPNGEVTAVVPAALRNQWRRVVTELDIAATIISHEAVSRGALPAAPGACILIDESHQYRNPGTKRYQYLARWLVGARHVLLLSATPVVNRLEDLAHQLLLAVRDDALIPRGCPSLLTSLMGGRPHPALGDLVLCRPRPASIPRAQRILREPALQAFEIELLERIDALELSTELGTATLIRMVLWRALASSPGALVGALARYLRLLDHARAAAQAGRPATRSAIRAFAGADQEQLLLWELLPTIDGAADLAMADREPLIGALAVARCHAEHPDAKCLELRQALADGAPTIVFTTSRDTLHWLRDRLSVPQLAWVTGASSGIGRIRMARNEVLQWFRPGAPLAPPGQRGPRILLATDVAAEGLDLQAAERVVNYDLPWTSVRLDQRAGRALRMGAARDSVEVVTFQPPAPIEARLRQLPRLEDKRRLTSRAGLDQSGRWLYRWRAELAAWGESDVATAGISVVEGAVTGWLLGLTLDAVPSNAAVQSLPALLLWLGDDGEVCDRPERLDPLLQEVAGRQWRCPTPEERRAAVSVVTPVVAAMLKRATGLAWQGGMLSPKQRRLARRVRRLGAATAARRDRAGVALLDQALAWLGGGVSAGEDALIRDISDLGPTGLLAVLPRLLTRPRQRLTLLPRLAGVVRVTSFSGCQPSIPSCSISTEPSSIQSS